MQPVPRYSSYSPLKFNDLLRGSLFHSSARARQPRKGDPTSLSISVLPIIKREVKRRLSRKEVCCLQDYDLETYLVELSLVDYRHYKGKPHSDMSPEELIEGVITNIRKDARYWIPESEIHTAVLAGNYSQKGAPQEHDDTEEDRAVSYKDLRSDVEANCKDAIFSTNRYMRLPRLPLILFPQVFQFVRGKEGAGDNVADLCLQNMVLRCLLRARHHHKIEITPREAQNDSKNVKFRRLVTGIGAQKGFLIEDVELLLEFKEFCHEHVSYMQDFDLEKTFDRYNELRIREETLLADTLRYCIEGYRNFLAGTGPKVARMLAMRPANVLDESTALFQYDISASPQVTNEVVTAREEATVTAYLKCQRPESGWFPDKRERDPEASLNQLSEQLLAYFNSPDQVQLRSYRYFNEDRPQWTKEDFAKFEEAMDLYNSDQLANKKIAKYMGRHIDANHVRYERAKRNKARKQASIAQ
jgi:hypothetical protein